MCEKTCNLATPLGVELLQGVRRQRFNDLSLTLRHEGIQFFKTSVSSRKHEMLQRTVFK